MQWEKAKLETVCKSIKTGKTPPTSNSDYFKDELNWFTPGDIGKKKILIEASRQVSLKAITDNRATLFEEGTVLITCIGEIGRVGILKKPASSNQQITGIKFNSQILPDFAYYWFLSAKKELQSLSNSALVAILNNSQLKKILIPLPPLPVQRAIADRLDCADALRQKDRQLLQAYDELAQGVFVEMFGDPVRNEKGWVQTSLKTIATKFSDGPFGSNLKTEHYRERGVTVIRLQNIGIGEFLNADKSFVDSSYFEEALIKHACQPGDVIIATLGDPNIRACIVPPTLHVAVNKADCIQCRVNNEVASPSFISFLLNHPAILHSAFQFMHGQTRVRISGGQLATLPIPLPPLPLQTRFATILANIEQQKDLVRRQQVESEALFGRLLQEAFG